MERIKQVLSESLNFIQLMRISDIIDILIVALVIFEIIIFIRKILEKESVILFQNAFPTLEKYIDHVHLYNGVPAKVGISLKNEILHNFKKLLKLKKRGINLFFTDIDKIKEQMLIELKKDN